MTRIAFIKGNKPDIWPLFARAKELWTDISDNIDSSDVDCRVFSFSQPIKDEELQEFFKYNAGSIFFLDNDFFPLELIQLIKKRSPQMKMFITIFGNFNFEMEKWHQVFKEVENTHTRFLVATKAHMNLLSYFVKEESIEVLPYPIDTQIFRPLGSSRDSEENFKLVYAGRISKPKNIDILLKLVLKANKLLSKKIELTLIGSYPSEKAIEHLGTQYQTSDFRDKILKLIKQSNGYIKHFEFCDHKKLIQFLQNADGFVSLSLNCNEEYGGAPREAFASGLRLLLTDWGGYKDLKYLPGVKLIPTKFINGLPCFNPNIALQKLFEFTQSAPSNGQRSDQEKIAGNEFSLASIERKIIELISKEHSPLVKLEMTNIDRYLSEFSGIHTHPFFEEKNGSIEGREIFTKIYQSYISN